MCLTGWLNDLMFKDLSVHGSGVRGENLSSGMQPQRPLFRFRRRAMHSMPR